MLRAKTILRALRLLALIAGAALILLRWGSLPATIPTHFGAGTIDGWGPKWMLWITWGAAVLCELAFSAAYLIPRDKWNMPVRLTDRNRAAAWRLTDTMIGLLALESVLTCLYVLACQCFFHPPGAAFVLVIILAPMVTLVVCLARFAFLPR